MAEGVYYNAANDYPPPTGHERIRLLGAKVRLPLTGEIVEFRETPAGYCAIVRVDDRWGFSINLFGCDVEALDILEVKND